MRLRLLTLTLAVLATPYPAAPAFAAPATPKQQAPTAAPAAGTVVLAARPGTPLDATARQLVTQDLTASRRANERPLVLTASAPLGTASERPALFVQLQSARDCGSAGCSTTIYLWRNGAWDRVLDGVGGTITISTHQTRGMADLTTDGVRYVWNGKEYRDTRPPPPPIDLRRRR